MTSTSKHWDEEPAHVTAQPKLDKQVDEGPAVTYVVAIVEQETERTIKTFAPCASERDAQRLERGVLINLDTDRYYTEIRHDAGETK